MFWYNYDKARLIIEDRALKEAFPRFRLYRHGNKLMVAGPLKTRYGNKYNLQIVYPDDYPHTCPKVFCKELLGTSTPHKFQDDSLCIQYREWKSSYTIQAVIGWAAHWLHSYDVWRRYNRWPGKEAAHG